MLFGGKAVAFVRSAIETVGALALLALKAIQTYKIRASLTSHALGKFFELMSNRTWGVIGPGNIRNLEFWFATISKTQI